MLFTFIFRYSVLLHNYTENQEGLHDIVKGMQKVLQEYGKDRMMIGEIYPDKMITEEDVISFYGNASSPEFNFPFNMELLQFFGGKFDSEPTASFRNAKKLRNLIDAYDAALPGFAQPNFVLGNHDVHRLRSRLDTDERLTRTVYTMLLTLRGTPTIYNGDEFGMHDGYVPPGERVDLPCQVNYTGSRCRDPQRT